MATLAGLQGSTKHMFEEHLFVSRASDRTNVCSNNPLSKEER